MWQQLKTEELAHFCGYEGFLPNFPKTCPKILYDFCQQIFSCKDHEDLFWYYLQGKVFICFYANVGRQCFEIKQRWETFLPGFTGVLFCQDCQGFCPDFQGFCPDFRQIKTFGGAPATRLLYH